jgi:hypothetical protein
MKTKNKRPTNEKSRAPVKTVSENVIRPEPKPEKETRPLDPAFRLLFDPQIPRPYRAASLVLIGLLYAAGIIHWVIFLHIDAPFYLSHDWWVDYSYYSTLKSAVINGVIPFHSSILVHATTRFLAIPETMSIFSPQVLLLPFMSIKNFMLVNLLLLYTIGFLGCLLLRKRHQMSLFAFTVFYLLFNYNGHIICHIAVGNYNWIGYFFFPFLMVYLFDLCGETPTYQSGVKLALVLFLMSLEGSFHLVTMFMMFFGFLLLFDYKNMKRLGVAAVLAGLLCLFRIWPAVISLKEEIAVPVHGFTLTNFISSLALTQHPLYFPWDNIIVGSWEFDHYISPLGFLVILSCGIIARFMPEVRNSKTRYTALMYAAFAFTILCFYHDWALVRGIIPFKVGERIPSRFLIVPLLIMLTLACVRLNVLRKWLYGNNWTAMLCLVGLLGLGDQLFMHSSDWIPADLLVNGNYTDPILVKGDKILAIDEPAYKIVVIVSTAISAGALLGTVAFLLYSGPWRNRSDYLLSGAITIWAAFVLAFFLWSEREPHQADPDIQVFSGFPAYVYKAFVPGYPGITLKIIFAEPLTVRSVNLCGTTGFPDSRVGGIMEFDSGKVCNTGPLPADGSSKTVPFEPSFKVPWLLFMSQSGGDPTHVLKSLELDASPAGS